MKISPIVPSLLLASIITTASADTILVPADYPTIQQAIDAAVGGDEIIVSQGTYLEQIDFLGKDIVVRSVNPNSHLVVASTIIDGGNDPDEPDYPQSPGTLVTLSIGTITGFTITRGYGDFFSQNESVGGVYAANLATVTRNVIRDNVALGVAGGIYAQDDAFVANNTIVNNTSTLSGGGARLASRVVFQDNIVANNESTESNGGGVSAYGDTLITGNVIADNFADRSGGGVYASGNCIVEGNAISGNWSPEGSGVRASQRSVIRNNTITANSGGPTVYLIDYLVNSGVLFTRNIVADNFDTGIRAFAHTVVHNNVISGNQSAYYSGGVWAGDDVLLSNNTILSNSGDDIGGVTCHGNATVVNNIIAFSVSGGGIIKPPIYTGLEDYNCVFGNVGGDYSDDFGSDPTPGPHDINEDPRLAFLDYHLLPDSPCIGTGYRELDFATLSGSDIDGERRVQSCNIDIGADEFLGEFTTVLSVLSSLPNGTIEVDVPDCNDQGVGGGSFNRYYTEPELVTLTITDTEGFDRWTVNGVDQVTGIPSVTVDMSVDNTASAVYSIIRVPQDSVTIQGAIDAASDGSVIIVEEGVYVEDIDFLGKSIILRSTNPMDWDVVAATVIDGSPPDTMTVALNDGEIAGFTIRNGHGGVEAEGTALVRRCIITQNENRGGVQAQNLAIITNNIITFNASTLWGGGVTAGLYVTVKSNLIAFNTSEDWGGGIHVASATGLIVGNTILANASFGCGGGIHVRDASGENPVIKNNIIAFSTVGGGICAGFNAITDFNCVFGNTGGNYVGPQGAGPNDINVDPMLDVDGLHLLPESPCINAGNPFFVPEDGETDIDGAHRVVYGTLDIGSDEWVNPGDVTGDNDVDFADFGGLQLCFSGSLDAPEWVEPSPTCRAVFDFDDDTDIDHDDFSAFLAAFTGP